MRREVKKGDKTFYKSPKIQRLVTEKRVRRKKLLKREKLNRFKASKEEKAKYDKVLSKYIKEKRAHTHAHAAPETTTAAAAPVKKAAKDVPVKAAGKQTQEAAKPQTKVAAPKKK